jgi:acetyl-CoA carboxylase biotin carboxyl carrier protein
VAQDSSLSWQQLLDLIAKLDGGEYDSVSVAFGDVSVQLSRNNPIGREPVDVAASPGAMSRELAPVPIDAPDHSHPAHPIAEALGAAITAPMLGVFYRRPAPGAEPFVAPGDSVDPETTIGIIEIMKLMNPVPAGVAGIIARFEAEDGAQVQFGQVLARIEA